MVCDKCEKKLTKVVCPEVWKGEGNTSKRKINENKILTSQRPSARVSSGPPTSSVGPERRQRKREGFNPYARKCKICNGSISLQGAYYCRDCSYKKGICAMCGKKVLDTSSYRQSAV
mmetsp:Transcript_15405/g.19600  ORF Transcript_15405/g.19600 Transcript_15405/m.19600 type:complete len:117 (-) Transcript_15405:431-781(-)